MCCVCNGSCNHVGPHSYCVAHGGSVYYPYVGGPFAPPVPSTVPNTGAGIYPIYAPLAPGSPPLFGFRFVPDACEHCFCREAVSGEAQDFAPHEECCNCGVRRLKA